MNNKHTPGPWVVGPSYGNDSARIDTEEGQVIGSIKVRQLVTVEKGHPVYAWSDELAANANLIAAAPELLELLKQITRKFDAHDDCTDIETTANLRNKCRAAIAKATGA